MAVFPPQSQTLGVNRCLCAINTPVAEITVSNAKSSPATFPQAAFLDMYESLWQKVNKTDL
jgi:hypothetical protein